MASWLFKSEMERLYIRTSSSNEISLLSWNWFVNEISRGRCLLRIHRRRGRDRNSRRNSIAWISSSLSLSVCINTRWARRSVHLLHSATRLSCNVLQIIVFSMSWSEKVIGKYRPDWMTMIFLASPLNLAWRHGWSGSSVGGESRDSTGKVKIARSTRQHHVVHIFHQEPSRWSGESSESISGKRSSHQRTKWLVLICQGKRY